MHNIIYPLYDTEVNSSEAELYIKRQSDLIRLIGYHGTHIRELIANSHIIHALTPDIYYKNSAEVKSLLMSCSKSILTLDRNH